MIPVSAKRLSLLFLVSISCFGLVAAIALGAVRLEHLHPETHTFVPHVFRQLLSAHKLLLFYFVTVPALIAVVGFGLLPRMSGKSRLALPRLALAAWAVFTAGGLLVIWALLSAGVDANWAFVAGQADPQTTVSVACLLGLAFGTLGTAVAALVLIANMAGQPTGSPQMTACFFGAATLQLLALPLVGSALVVALFAIVNTPDSAGTLVSDVQGIPAWLVALSAKPLKLSILLAALGTAAHLTATECTTPQTTVRRTRIYVVALVISACLAVETRALPGDVPTGTLMLAGFFNVLMLMPLCALTYVIFSPLLRKRPVYRTPHLYAGAIGLLVFMLTPIDVLTQFPGLRMTAIGYMSTAIDTLLVSGCALLALAGSLHAMYARAPHSGRGIAIMMFAGLCLMAGPMFPLGIQGVSMEFAVYPREALPLQVASAYGAAFLAISILASILQLAIQRLRPAPPSIPDVQSA